MAGRALPCSGGRVRGGGYSFICWLGYRAAELVAQRGFFFGKQNRKDLQTAGAKCASAVEQIKSPHPPETFTITVGETRPGAFEIFVPGKQGRIVVQSNVFYIFQHEDAFRGAGQLACGRKNRVWKNVALDPGIGVEMQGVVADSL